MRTSPLKSLLLTLWFVVPLISCSSSGGIGGSGMTSQGTVSEIGSIFVNGTEFDTSNAVVIVEGEEKGVGDGVVLNNLDVGKVVTVYGTRSEDGQRGVANRVTYNDNVEGPVESVIVRSATRKDIVVLGQTVIVNVITRFKGVGFTFDTIAVDDVVEVSGFADDTGAIWATFLERTDGLVFEVAGFVDNLNAGLKTFEINNLTVDYSAADASGLPGGVPVEDLFVEVGGVLAPTGELLADLIELGDQLEVENADEIELTGFVRDDTLAPGEFTLGNQVVRTVAATIFVDGTAGDIASGQKLNAEGRLENGILYAREIEFWEPDQIEVEGLVAEDASAPAQFTVGTQVVQTDVGTVYEDITPGEIVLGVRLEVKGVPVDIDRSILIADKVSLEVD